MADRFEPTIAHAIFGQPHQEFAVPEIMYAALLRLQDRLDTVMWNIHQEQYYGPFSNSGNSFKNDTFEAHAYSWDEKEDQTFNFAWRDLRISWYKYLGRGMSSNIDISPDLASECLVDCLASLDRMDEENWDARLDGGGA